MPQNLDQERRQIWKARFNGLGALRAVHARIQYVELRSWWAGILTAGKSYRICARAKRPSFLIGTASL
jgi:hypothetical protein